MELKPYQCPTCYKTFIDVKGHIKRGKCKALKPAEPTAAPPSPPPEPEPEPEIFSSSSSSEPPAPAPEKPSPAAAKPSRWGPPLSAPEYDPYLEHILEHGEAPMPMGGWETMPAKPSPSAMTVYKPHDPTGDWPTNHPYVEKVVNSLIRAAKPAKGQAIPPCWMLLQHVWPTAKKAMHGSKHDPEGNEYFSIKLGLTRDTGDKLFNNYLTSHLYVRRRFDNYFIATAMTLRTTAPGHVHEEVIKFEAPIPYNHA